MIQSRICINIKLVRFPKTSPEQPSLKQPKNTGKGKKVSEKEIPFKLPGMSQFLVESTGHLLRASF